MTRAVASWALILGGSVGCVHVPPRPVVPGAWTVTTERRYDQWTRGELCSWEAEQLTFAGQPLWVSPPPEGEGACPPGNDAARTADVVGQDGPFLSAILRERDDAQGLSTVRCVTWDLATRLPTTLDGLDQKRAEHWRATAAAELVADPSLAGWLMTGDSFVLREHHVVYCLVRGDQMRELPIR